MIHKIKDILSAKLRKIIQKNTASFNYTGEKKCNNCTQTIFNGTFFSLVAGLELL